MPSFFSSHAPGVPLGYLCRSSSHSVSCCEGGIQPALKPTTLPIVTKPSEIHWLGGDDWLDISFLMAQPGYTVLLGASVGYEDRTKGGSCGEPNGSTMCFRSRESQVGGEGMYGSCSTAWSNNSSIAGSPFAHVVGVSSTAGERSGGAF